MSIQTPPTLEELGRQVLLRNQTLAISALEIMPIMLFPELFKDAFTCRLTRIVKAMVAAWPFPCLPVGALVKTFNLGILHNLLNEMDVLSTKNIPHRKGKLQEINFRRVHHEFWTRAGALDGDCTSETVSEKQAVKAPPTCELRRHLKVITDLCFSFQLDEDEMYILKWAQQRKDSLQLCCVNLKIVSLSLDNVRMVLTVFQPEHLEVLELSIDWSWCTLAQFSLYLSQMRNLHTLSLVRIHKNRFGVENIPGLWQKKFARMFDVDDIPDLEEKKYAGKFISQFSRLNSLQHLSINGISFRKHHMKRLLRYLETPLETFAVTHCQLLQSHLSHVSQCQRLHQLKHLDLTGVLLSGLCVKPLTVLLENVAHTLETLQLQGCGIKDSQLRVLLPALSQCFQLTTLNLYTNDFSMDALCDLLLHTANLSKMAMEQYPAPLESYEFGYVSIERFVQFCPVLMDTLRAIRQPKRISFATHVCSKCFKRCVYDQETRLCSCLQ